MVHFEWPVLPLLSTSTECSFLHSIFVLSEPPEFQLLVDWASYWVLCAHLLAMAMHLRLFLIIYISSLSWSSVLMTLFTVFQRWCKDRTNEKKSSTNRTHLYCRVACDKNHSAPRYRLRRHANSWLLPNTGTKPARSGAQKQASSSVIETYSRWTVSFFVRLILLPLYGKLNTKFTASILTFQPWAQTKKRLLEEAKESKQSSMQSPVHPQYYSGYRTDGIQPWYISTL